MGDRNKRAPKLVSDPEVIRIRSRERFVMKSVQLALAKQDVKEEHEDSESSPHNQTDCSLGVGS